MVVLPAEARGVSRGNVRRLTPTETFSLSLRFGLVWCGTRVWSRCQQKPESRAEGMCDASRLPKRFPSACASGLYGVVLACGCAANRSPRREPRECASLHGYRNVFPQLALRAFAVWYSRVVALPTEARGASRGNVHCLTPTETFFLSVRFGLVWCGTRVWLRCQQKPEARAEGMCLVSQRAMRFPQ